MKPHSLVVNCPRTRSRNTQRKTSSTFNVDNYQTCMEKIPSLSTLIPPES